MFPAPWDLLITHGGKRYALLDRYRVNEDADEVPIAIEVIDLVAGASVGTAKVQQDHASDPGKRARQPVTPKFTLSPQQPGIDLLVFPPGYFCIS